MTTVVGRRPHKWYFMVEPRPERPGVLVTLSVETAYLVADALEIVSPEETWPEQTARALAAAIRHEADKEVSDDINR